MITRYGKIEGSVSGPRTVRVSMISEAVILIDKTGRLSLENGTVELAFEVTDPEAFFRRFGRDSARLQSRIQATLDQHRELPSTSLDAGRVGELIAAMEFPMRILPGH